MERVFEKIIISLRALLLVSLIGTASSAALLLTRASQAVTDLPNRLERQIRQQGDALRTTAAREVAATRRDTLAEIHQTRKELLQETNTAIDRLDGRTASIQTSLDRQLDAANGSLRQIATLSQEVKPVLNRGAAIEAQVDEALPLFLDCGHNPDCVFNRYVGTSRGIEKAADAIGKAAPGTAAAVESTSKSVASVAAVYSRKAPLYKEILDWAFRGLTLWKLF